MQRERKPLILGIGGAVRAVSSSEQALRVSVEARRLFDGGGGCIDDSALFQLETVGRQVAEFALLRTRACEAAAA